jgi:hypothetical protein
MLSFVHPPVQFSVASPTPLRSPPVAFARPKDFPGNNSRSPKPIDSGIWVAIAMHLTPTSIAQQHSSPLNLGSIGRAWLLPSRYRNQA